MCAEVRLIAETDGLARRVERRQARARATARAVQRPAPLRTDGSNAFARFSMQVRVPRIVRDVVEQNPDYPTGVKRALEDLAAGIESGAPLPAPRGPAPDLAAWSADHAEHAAETWLAAEWFHAELAAYREIASRARFWETGRDPFAKVKEEELASDTLWARLEAALAVARAGAERLAGLLDASLWGNRVDLSYRVATGLERSDQDLIVDDRATAARRLMAARRVDLIADNTGTELALDLALVDAILDDSPAVVTLHLKMQPVFVSDALTRDVWRLVESMRGRGRDACALGGRLLAAFETERLRLAPDPFWSGPRFLWRAPPYLLEGLAAADVVILKGDANYRRLVGDAVWPADARFSDAASYVGACVVCARTMKSDSVVGVPARLAGELDATEPRWRIDGRRGVVQVHPA